METNRVAISIKGVPVEVPSVSVECWTVISTGRLPRIASVFDEEWLEGDAVNNAEVFLTSLRNWEAKPDIFSFARKLPETKVRYPYPYEWDNVAAIPITTYSDWWEKRVSHDLRKDVKRAEKRGVAVRRAEFDDALVRGIKELYDEAPVRQGRPFWHYGKSLEVVKRENATYLERSDFLGAFCGEELVGFMKIVYVDGLARMMQILARASHSDKRPMNALIEKAVELAAERHCSYLTYGNYTYGNKTKDSVVDFKRRNGFERIRFPRYFIPLTVRGRLAMMARLHLGVQALLPARLIYLLLYARARMRRGTPTQTELPVQRVKSEAEPRPEQVSLQP
jgi:hypothetical protein